MFCWEAMAALDRQEAGWLAAGETRHLQAHLVRCAACAAERRRRDDLVALVREAGRVQSPLAPAGFEAAVLRAARSRMAQGRAPAPARAIPWLAPLRVAAAAAVVIGALLLSVLRGPAPGDGTSGAPGGPGSAMAGAAMDAAGADDPLIAASLPDDGDDRVAPPREIPFTVREDLVGARRGRIPTTTYVLEPPPAEAVVVRASL